MKPFFFFLLAWSGYLFYSLFQTEPHITFDGVLYTHIARNILFDGHLGWQATMTNPLYSVLIAAVYPFSGDLLLSSLIISKLMSSFLVLSTYLLVRDLFGERAAFFSSILVVVHPHILFLSNFPEPEITYMAILFFSLWCLLRAYRRSSFLWALAGTFFSAMSYLTRSEGLFIFCFVIIIFSFLTFSEWKFNKREKDEENKADAVKIKKNMLIIPASILFFLVLATPYLLFLKESYGRYVWSPKSTSIAMVLKLETMGLKAEQKPIFPLLSYLRLFSKISYDGSQELWGITSEGKLAFQDPKKIDEAKSYIFQEPLKFGKKYVSNFSKQLPGRMGSSSGQENFPQPYPWYYFFPALLFILYSLYSGKNRSQTLFLASPLMILFLIPAFTGGWWKYLTPYAPVFIIFTVRFFELISDYFGEKKILELFAILLVIYSLWCFGYKANTADSARSRKKMMLIEERERAGLWAQKQFKDNPTYMVQWNKLAYYLGGRWIVMPSANYDQIIAFARKNKVDYLIFETWNDKEKWLISKLMTNNKDLSFSGAFQGEILKNYYTLFYKLQRNGT